MNAGLWTLIAWVVLILAPFATGGLCWHFGLVEGAHRGRCAEKERQLERERRKAMRAPYEGPEIRAKTGPIMPDLPIPLTAFGKRSYVAAADLAPVVVPEPETVIPMRPQPAGTGPHTRTMPAVTDTGEIRALTAETDAWLAGMRRKGLIT